MKDNLRDAAQAALETLEDVFGKDKIDVSAINNLRAALAEPVVKDSLTVQPSDTPLTDALDAELTEREMTDEFRIAAVSYRALHLKYCALEKELAAAQADAERYRWLRERPVGDCTAPRIEVNMWTCNVNDDGVGDSVNEGDVLAGDALDAAIDKAMLGEKE